MPAQEQCIEHIEEWRALCLAGKIDWIGIVGHVTDGEQVGCAFGGDPRQTFSAMKGLRALYQLVALQRQSCMKEEDVKIKVAPPVNGSPW